MFKFSCFHLGYSVESTSNKKLLSLSVVTVQSRSIYVALLKTFGSKIQLDVNEKGFLHPHAEVNDLTFDSVSLLSDSKKAVCYCLFSCQFIS